MAPGFEPGIPEVLGRAGLGKTAAGAGTGGGHAH